VVEESDELEYVLVGTADEVERERRREEGAEAALEAGLNDRVPELLEEAESEVAARKARVDEYTRSRRAVMAGVVTSRPRAEGDATPIFAEISLM
jgi:hypothetical protein